MTFEEDIAAAVRVLRAGGVILYPTDTIWGIGCDATNAAAVERVFKIKERDPNKSLITLFDSINRLMGYAPDLSDAALSLLEAVDGSGRRPVTVIIDGVRGVAPSVKAADGSLGVRITAERYSRELCYRFQKPLVSTSANKSGRPAPTLYEEIPAGILEAVDYTASFRRDDNTRCVPSSVVKIGMRGEVRVIRE